MDCSPPSSSVYADSAGKNNWSELPFPILGDLPDPETEPDSLTSPALASGFFTTASLDPF